MPVARLAAAARARGALVMIDGAHAPGMLGGLDVPALGADWYVGNLHKWCFTLKGVALLHAADGVRESRTQGGIISHFWKRSFAERFFMQGTLDYSRYLSAPAAMDFVARELGGWRAMQAHNAALVEAGAALLEDAWANAGECARARGGPRRLLEPYAALRAEGAAAPFLVVLLSPLDWRAWTARAAGGAVGLAGLSDAEAEAAIDADDELPERIANAVLAVSGVQSVFFRWRVGGANRIMCRIAAQVYNGIEDYQRLAEAVLRVHAEQGRRLAAA